MTRPIDTFDIRPSNAPPGYASDVNAYGDGQFVRNDDHKAEIGRLTERMRELDADANRYRWIRQAGAWESELGIDDLSKDPAKFDAAVDERIATSALAKREG